MKRYDLNDECDGESGRCRAQIVDKPDGEFVRFVDVKPSLDYLHALRKQIRNGLAETPSRYDVLVALDRRHLPMLDAILGDYRLEGAVAGHDGDG